MPGICLLKGLASNYTWKRDIAFIKLENKKIKK